MSKWFKKIDGQLHKLCTGPAHDEPVWLPATDKYFYKRRSGKRKGEFISRCRLCSNWAKVQSPGSNQGWVSIEKVRHFYAEADRRIGIMELARRTGLSYGGLSSVLNGTTKQVQKAKLKLVILEVVSARRKGEDYASAGISWRVVKRQLAANAKAYSARREAARDINLHDQEMHLARIRPVDLSSPDPTWWHNTGQEWLPRYGEEMLGADF